VRVFDEESPPSTITAAIGGSEDDKENEVNPFFTKPRHSAIKCQIFSRNKNLGKTTHDFFLSSEKFLIVPINNVLRKIDPQFHLPRGVRLLDSDGVDIPPHTQAGSVLPPPPLKCIDLFCGMGGLSIGLEDSGAAVVTAGVDGVQVAIKTFKGSHPDASIVACDDVCRFLMQYGAKLERLVNGGMSLLVGGPPCQGFSGANTSSPSQKSEKTIGMAIFTEAVSRLRPEFVIIENVRGLLRAPNGVLDSVILCLVSLGYQTRVRVVNAGCYGVAQNRVRVIVLAAKYGLPLPEIPVPTHVFHAGGYNARDPLQPCNLELRRKHAYRGVPVAWRGCVIVPTNALLPRESIESTIGDLPIDDEDGEVEYKTEPKSVFQANVRTGVTSDKVYNHETNSWKIRVDTQDRIEAVPKESDLRQGIQFEGTVLACENPNIPEMAGDWRDIPFSLLTDELRAAVARTLPKNWGRFGRLMWRSHCGTILTQSCMKINSDTCGPVIHPEAERVLTVREVARLQGIPDRVKISGSLSEKYRQVGNGVPSPLAEAVGREIRKAVCEAHRKCQYLLELAVWSGSGSAFSKAGAIFNFIDYYLDIHCTLLQFLSVLVLLEFVIVFCKLFYQVV